MARFGGRQNVLGPRWSAADDDGLASLHADVQRDEALLRSGVLSDREANVVRARVDKKRAAIQRRK
jgi:hypothetical protein